MPSTTKMSADTVETENQRLREELEVLRAEKVREETERLQAHKEAHKYDNLPEELDGRHQIVEIVYGPNAQNMRAYQVPLIEGFQKLVSYYGSFSKPTDRNVPRQYIDEMNVARGCNQVGCFVKKTFSDLMSGQKIENMRKEVPLWLAVDDAVQKGQQVELITFKEFDDFYKEEARKEIRASKAYREKQQAILIEQTLKEELG